MPSAAATPSAVNTAGPNIGAKYGAAIISAAAPIVAHPPGMVSCTDLSKLAAALPIAGPGSIDANP